MAESLGPPATCAIVLNYFGATRTEQCLLSLADEPLGTLYLIDNSAAPGERDALESVLARVRELHPTLGVRTVFNDRNLGFARGVNQAVTLDRASQAPHTHYLLFNNDALAVPGLLRALHARMAVDPRVTLVAPRIRWGVHERCVVWYQRATALLSDSPLLLAFPYLTGCCLLVDATVAANGRIFDEDFFMYGEDVELGWRVQRAGGQVASADDVVIYHEGTGSSGVGGLFYEYHMVRGHLLLARKLARHPLEVPLLALGRVLPLLVRAVARSVRFGSFVPLSALLLASGGVPVPPPGERGG